MKSFEGALQGNDTLLNVHSKRKRARWRMIASRDDTPVWPRGATLNATSLLLATLLWHTRAHNHRLPDVCLFKPSHHQHTHFTRILEFGQTRPRPAFCRLGLVHIVQLRLFRGRSARVNVSTLEINEAHCKPLWPLMGSPSDDPKVLRQQHRTLNALSSKNVMLTTNKEFQFHEKFLSFYFAISL